MEQKGVLKLIFDAQKCFMSTYTISKDGRVIINKWPTVLKQQKYKIGQKMIFMIHRGLAGTALMVSSIPDDF